MTDLGLSYPMEEATAGEEPPRELKVNMNEAHKAQEVAKESHAYATPSSEDRPLELIGNHKHHPHPEK